MVDVGVWMDGFICVCKLFVMCVVCVCNGGPMLLLFSVIVFCCCDIFVLSKKGVAMTVTHYRDAYVNQKKEQASCL